MAWKPRYDSDIYVYNLTFKSWPAVYLSISTDIRRSLTYE